MSTDIDRSLGFTQKGELLTYSTTTNNIAILPPGLDGQILSADSLQPMGLKYITIPGIVPSKIIITLLNITALAIDFTNFISVGNFSWKNASFGTFSSGGVIFNTTIIDRNLDIRLYDITNNVVLGSILNIGITGSYNFAVINPLTDADIQLQIRKTASGGTSPTVFGAVAEYQA